MVRKIKFSNNSRHKKRAPEASGYLTSSNPLYIFSHHKTFIAITISNVGSNQNDLMTTEYE